jgi:hypothetical protein
VKKFFVVYHAPAQWNEMKDATPEQMQDGMKKWMVWAEKCGEHLVDMGNPLVGGRKVKSSGVAPSDKDVVGFSVLQAESMDDAVGLLKEHPHLDWADECDIEVHEYAATPGT